MGFFDKALSKYREPDVIEPLTSNVSNYIYFDSTSGADDLDLFRDTAKFVAREFTKIKVTVTEGTPSRDQILYLMNLKPNGDQTANQLLYDFAYSLVRRGKVWYKVNYTAKQPDAIYISQVYKAGYKEFNAPQLKLMVPTTLIEQYSGLIATLSTQHSSSVLEIQSQIKTGDASDPNSDNVVDAKIRNRLQRVQNNMRQFGMFFTNPNEATKDHANLSQPDGTALEDLRTMIYQQLHISPKMLDGSYTESDYRAFYATHLQPIGGALDELLNSELMGRENYIKGFRIESILDLMQFATLDSFTQMAKESIYSGYLQLDDIRHSLGKEDYPDGLGKIIFSNKNAVALNNADVNNLLMTGGTTTNEEDSTGDTSGEDNNQ